ncbi:hypothetical protein GGI05_000484 [Coemansia sp. RSA 2603]|nr:hypothetical protein GGI05_000484 [Coemansia sp. RSA 2603]
MSDIGAISDTQLLKTEISFNAGLTKRRRRPPYSYTALIAQAILVSEHKQLTLREIYDSINRMCPQICQGPDVGWQNTIRHNLSLNICFRRIPRHELPPSQSIKLRGKGSYWTVDLDLMESNTRKRVEDAVEKGTLVSVLLDDNESERPTIGRKRQKSMHSVSKSSPIISRLPSSPDTKLGSGIALGRSREFSVNVQNYTQSANSSPYSFIDRDDIQYVSPAAQSSSPYFQSTMNSPISSVPNIANKHMSSPISRNHFPRGSIDFAPTLPPMSTAFPPSYSSNGRYFARMAYNRNDNLVSSTERPSTMRVVSTATWENNSVSPPPLDNSGLSVLAYAGSQRQLGTTVLCARSTARGPLSGDDQNIDHTNASTSSELSVSRPPASEHNHSPESLSPVSTIIQINDNSIHETGNTTSESTKFRISHLIN